MLLWPTKEEGGFKVLTLWKETRALPAGAMAEVEAFVVPASGVGWVELSLWSFSASALGQKSRLLGDWYGQSQASVTRQVVRLADEWFAYCEERTGALRTIDATREA